MSEPHSKIGIEDATAREGSEADEIVRGLTRLLAAAGPDDPAESQATLDQIRSILGLNEHARTIGISLKAAAEEQAKIYRRALEFACVHLLEHNRQKERAVRWAAQMLDNMGSARAMFRDGIRAINASASEIASDAGRQYLAKELARYVDRTDTWKSRAFLVVHGWCGTANDLHNLARVTHEHRCMLITDGPSYNSLNELRNATAHGGALEQLAGEQMFHRHTVVLANEGRVRRRFKGDRAAEKRGCNVPLSGPWFGEQLCNAADRAPWASETDRQRPIPGISGVKLDLRLEDRDSLELYSRHRVNVAMLRGEDGKSVVVRGPVTLSKAGNPVPSGVAMVENQVIRYAEWIVNRYGSLADLAATAEVVSDRLRQFVTLNSGNGRVFRDRSHVAVSIDAPNRALDIKFTLDFRDLQERIVIRLSEPVKGTRVGKLAASWSVL